MAVLKQKQLQLAAVEAELKVIQIELEDKNRQLKVGVKSTICCSLLVLIFLILGITRHF